jgi:hypothetical protein
MGLSVSAAPFYWLKSAPPVESAIKVTSQKCGPNLYALEKLEKKGLGRNIRSKWHGEPTLLPDPRPLPPEDTGTRDRLFYCNDPLF